VGNAGDKTMNRYRKIILVNALVIGCYAVSAAYAFKDQQAYKELIIAQGQAQLIEQMNPRAQTAAMIVAPILTLTQLDL
jgi:hypothetical protein